MAVAPGLTARLADASSCMTCAHCETTLPPLTSLPVFLILASTSVRPGGRRSQHLRKILNDEPSARTVIWDASCHVDRLFLERDIERADACEVHQESSVSARPWRRLSSDPPAIERRGRASELSAPSVFLSTRSMAPEQPEHVMTCTRR